MDLEWDENKRESNLEKYGLDFVDAARVLQGDLLELDDCHDEPASLPSDCLVQLWWWLCTETYRIISMRKAEPNEERTYFEALF